MFGCNGFTPIADPQIDSLGIRYRLDHQLGTGCAIFDGIGAQVRQGSSQQYRLCPDHTFSLGMDADLCIAGQAFK
jgi:hypothetical protein